MFEACAALALWAPRAALTPVPWGTVGSATAPSKGKEYEGFSMVHVHFSLFLHLSNTCWKTQKF